MKGLEYFAHVNSVDDPLCRRQISKWSVALIRSLNSCTVLLSWGCPANMSSLLSKTILKSPAKRHLWLSLYLFSTISSSFKNKCFSLSSFGPYTLTTTYASPLCINEMAMMRSWLISTLTPDISTFWWVRITCPLLSYTISRFTGFNPVRNFGSQPGYPARRGWGTWKERGPRWSWLGSGVVDASRRAGSM